MHGFLILDKPLGVTSAQAVGAVKRLFKPSKIGHGGTLDPLASGILPLALGEATKTFDYIVTHEKEYRFTVTWGEARSTDDAEGEVVARSEKRPTRAEIEAILPQFQGISMQRPPAFSAISTGGKRAYAMARAGEAVELAARPVEVVSLALESDAGDLNPSKCEAAIADGGSEAVGARPPSLEKSTFILTCGKGTYVRSLARDMGELLGCYGYVSALRRTRVGKFSEKSAISLDGLREIAYEAAPNLPLLAIEDVLDDIPAVFLDAPQSLALRQGQSLAMRDDLPPGILRAHDASGKLLAMARNEGGTLKPVRVFNL